MSPGKGAVGSVPAGPTDRTPHMLCWPRPGCVHHTHIPQELLFGLGWAPGQGRQTRCHLGLWSCSSKGTGLSPPGSASPISRSSLCLAPSSAGAATRPPGGSHLSGRVNGSVSAPDPAESCGSGFICCYCCFQVEN